MDKPPRPKYDPRIERRYGTLLDSLVMQMGHAPDSVNVNPSLVLQFGDRGHTRGNVVSVGNVNDSDALFHELGHFWSINEQDASRQLGDSAHFDPYGRKGGERLAEDYGSLLQARGDTTQVDNRDSKLLYRILNRVHAPAPTPRAGDPLSRALLDTPKP